MVSLGLVVAEFNRPITEEMEASARQAAIERDAHIAETVYVPGSFDTPLAADRLARKESIEGVVVIGAIISGETDHEYVIGDAAASGLTDVSLERDVPVTLGITGPGMTAEEARDRVEYGAQAVASAIELIEEYE